MATRKSRASDPPISPLLPSYVESLSEEPGRRRVQILVMQTFNEVHAQAAVESSAKRRHVYANAALVLAALVDAMSYEDDREALSALARESRAQLRRRTPKVEPVIRRRIDDTKMLVRIMGAYLDAASAPATAIQGEAHSLAIQDQALALALDLLTGARHWFGDCIGSRLDAQARIRAEIERTMRRARVTADHLAIAMLVAWWDDRSSRARSRAKDLLKNV